MHKTVAEIQLELGCKPANTFGATVDPNILLDLEKQASSDVRPIRADEGMKYDSDKHILPSDAKPDNDSSYPNEAIEAVRPRMSRALTGDDMREINARLLHEAERAAPLRVELDRDDASVTSSENAHLDRLTTGGSIAPATRGATPENRMSFTSTDFTKINGSARRMKQHFMARILCILPTRA